MFVFQPGIFSFIEPELNAALRFILWKVRGNLDVTYRTFKIHDYLIAPTVQLKFCNHVPTFSKFKDFNSNDKLNLFSTISAPHVQLLKAGL